MVVGLRQELLLRILLGLDHQRVVRWELDILDEQRLWLVNIGFAVEDDSGISRHRCPAMMGDGVGRGSHGDNSGSVNSLVVALQIWSCSLNIEQTSREIQEVPTVFL